MLIANSVTQPNHSCNYFIETIPLPPPIDSFQVQLEPPNNSNIESINSEILIPNISSEDGLNVDQIQESSIQHPAQINTQRPKVGRCHFVIETKTRKKCDSCLTFVCPLHSKNIVLCEHCNEKISLVWPTNSLLIYRIFRYLSIYYFLVNTNFYRNFVF